MLQTVGRQIIVSFYLQVIQYYIQGVTNKPQKVKTDTESNAKQPVPENLTCHFSFGVETLRIPEQ